MNEIVNLRDQLDNNFETDRLLKLLYNNLKSFQKERTVSSKNDDELLVNWALNELYLLQLKKMMKSDLNRLVFSKHSVKSTVNDIWSITAYLVTKSLERSTKNRFFLNSTSNLLHENLDELFSNILKYNSQYIFESHSKTLNDDMTTFFQQQDVLLSNKLTSLTLSTLVLDEMNQMFVN
jgi:hypothetical protein